jgi:arginase family enzyme
LKSIQAAVGVHADLDGAWDGDGLSRIDLRAWGPRLRFTAPSRLIEQFHQETARELGDFILFGSGDFHHLSAVWLRRFRSPLTLISFDNHPDWDRRPPRWSCGGWINRALEMEHVQRAVVWGCGNFELKWPNRIFGNRAAVRSGKLQLFAWDERYGTGDWSTIRRESWKTQFEAFAGELRGGDVYVTIDMDCLLQTEALTQWEQGLFTAEDVAWALKTLRASARVVGGDLCGAWSPPMHARRTQAFASGFDHPKIPGITIAKAREVNIRAFRALWPALTSSCV